MCMSPSSLDNCAIYSTWCIMICPVIPILSLLLLIQSQYSLSKLLHLLLSCPFLVITLDIEHLPTIILVNIRSKGLMKQFYFPGAKPIQLHCVPLHVLRPEHVPICIHVHLHSWLGLMTERVNEEILPGRKRISMQQIYQLLYYNVY